MSGLRVREMRARDMVKHSRYIVPRFFGLVAELDGREIGAASIVIGHSNRPFLSLDMAEELRRFPLLMHRLAKQMVAAGVSQLGELYAIEAKAEPKAERWLLRLGFRPIGEKINGERVFKWHP